MILVFSKSYARIGRLFRVRPRRGLGAGRAPVSASIFAMLSAADCGAAIETLEPSTSFGKREENVDFWRRSWARRARSLKAKDGLLNPSISHILFAVPDTIPPQARRTKIEAEQ